MEVLRNKKAGTAAKQAFAQKTAELDKVICPLPHSVYHTDVSFRDLTESLGRLERDYGPVDLTPDFQRRHVWALEQKRAFIEAVLRGAVVQELLTLQFNCPHWEEELGPDSDLPPGLQLMDGLQRYTAISEYVAGKLSIFGGYTVKDFEGSSYHVKSYSWRLRLHVFAFRTKRELLGYYLAINEGGTPHSKVELDRVRSMRDALLCGGS